MESGGRRGWSGLVTRVYASSGETEKRYRIEVDPPSGVTFGHGPNLAGSTVMFPKLASSSAPSTNDYILVLAWRSLPGYDDLAPYVLNARKN